MVQESEKTQLYSGGLMNNECLSAVSEAGIKEGADGVWTCKHLHGYGCNYLDNQKVFLSFGLHDTEEKISSLHFSCFWKAAVHTVDLSA